jgi:BirA family biotin operon repressor/biotin-[acetyl-CoA-carboxylase] ligase
MDLEPVRHALRGTSFADVRGVAETGSTNADVVALAAGGHGEGLVLVADHQTAGRGRLDRRWAAPPASSLLLSVLFRPREHGLALDELHLVPTAMGVAMAEAARSVTRDGAAVQLKWPNDLVVAAADDGGHGPVRKVGGILAEAAGDAALVVGVGLNVNWPAVLPADLEHTATALNHLTGGPVDRSGLLVAALRRLHEWYAGLGTPAGRVALLARYRELSATIGQRVRVELGGETVVGDAIDVNAEGHLLVVDECPDRPREIVAGDVVQLRPVS